MFENCFITSCSAIARMFSVTFTTSLITFSSFLDGTSVGTAAPPPSASRSSAAFAAASAAPGGGSESFTTDPIVSFSTISRVVTTQSRMCLWVCGVPWHVCRVPWHRNCARSCQHPLDSTGRERERERERERKLLHPGIVEDGTVEECHPSMHHLSLSVSLTLSLTPFLAYG